VHHEILVTKSYNEIFILREANSVMKLNIKYRIYIYIYEGIYIYTWIYMIYRYISYSNDGVRLHGGMKSI
jgi:hypothetical protein